MSKPNSFLCKTAHTHVYIYLDKKSCINIQNMIDTIYIG